MTIALKLVAEVHFYSHLGCVELWFMDANVSVMKLGLVARHHCKAPSYKLVCQLLTQKVGT